MEKHPHTRIVTNCYLNLFHQVERGTLDPFLFPRRAEDIEMLCLKVICNHYFNQAFEGVDTLQFKMTEFDYIPIPGDSQASIKYYLEKKVVFHYRKDVFSKLLPELVTKHFTYILQPPSSTAV
jgi:hypothetical protein